MTEPVQRRPLASRQTAWAGMLTRRLAATSVTPNQISMAGMVMALLSGICLGLAGSADGLGRVLLLLAAAGFCQLRLLCNLLDGMVAVEAGKAAPDGPFWNEFPDRVSDMFILVGAGIGAAVPGLGWIAVSMAFLTAYIRELGSNCGADADFSGPMAKPHRMAVITGGALLSLFEPVLDGNGSILAAALAIIAIGSAMTAMRRAVRLIRFLRLRSQDSGLNAPP